MRAGIVEGQVETIVAHTEIGADRTPDEVVRFINISGIGPDTVRIMMRDREGRFVEMDLTNDEWGVFRQQVIEHG